MAAKALKPADYKSLWHQLKKDNTKYDYLWDHQSEILERYHGLAATTQDVALCLPTGTGKTLVALLIGKMASVHQRGPILYLCPNNLLVRQVIDEATSLGIDARNLSGEWNQIPLADRTAYASGQALGVAPYSTLYNANPRPDTPGLIIFDDVHAASSATIAPWQVEVKRTEHPNLFGELERLFQRTLVPGQYLVLGPDPVPENRRVELVPHRDWLPLTGPVQALLDQHLAGTNLAFPWRRLKNNLARCFCFLSSNSILMRTWCPASFDVKQFAEARRRVYMSATLDRWGHLERIVGIKHAERLSIESVPVPGRRLILNTEALMPKMAPLDRIRLLVDNVPKTLVLCKSQADATRVVQKLQATDYKGHVLTVEVIKETLEAFTKPRKAVLVLAGRYDGMDLGRGMCHQIILWSAPTAIDPLERFTMDTGRATKAATARARHRIQQGMGRCTRKEGEAALVSLVGEDLIQFLANAAVRNGLPQRIRAELAVADDHQDPRLLNDLFRAFLERGEDWERFCDTLDASVDDFPVEVQDDEEVAKLHRKEARYNQLFWSEAYPEAAQVAAGVAQDFVGAQAEGPAALWFYLASVAADVAAWEKTQNASSDQGSGLLEEAARRAHGRAWFGRLQRGTALPTGQVIPTVDPVLQFLRRFPTTSDKLQRWLQEALEDLKQTEPNRYHRGLRSLGESLGFRAMSPKRDGAADVIWGLDKTANFVFDAKTQKTANTLHLNEARKLAEQPAGTASNDGFGVPAGLRSTAVTNDQFVADEAKHLRDAIQVLRPANVLAFAEKWFETLQRLQVSLMKADDNAARRHVQTALKFIGAAPNELYATLGIEPATEALVLGTEQAQA